MTCGMASYLCRSPPHLAQSWPMQGLPYECSMKIITGCRLYPGWVIVIKLGELRREALESDLDLNLGSATYSLGDTG